MAINSYDIVSTLQALGMMKYWKGKHIILKKQVGFINFSVLVEIIIILLWLIKHKLNLNIFTSGYNVMSTSINIFWWEMIKMCVWIRKSIAAFLVNNNNDKKNYQIDVCVWRKEHEPRERVSYDEKFACLWKKMSRIR